MTAAILLFGHGSRDPLWLGPIEAVAARLRSQSAGMPVACAYLELCEPDLATATSQLVGLGATSISIVPMFLGMGRHAREDLPALVSAARAAHPGVVFTLKRPVGEDEQLINLMAEIATS